MAKQIVFGINQTVLVDPVLAKNLKEATEVCVNDNGTLSLFKKGPGITGTELTGILNRNLWTFVCFTEKKEEPKA